MNLIFRIALLEQHPFAINLNGDRYDLNVIDDYSEVFSLSEKIITAGKLPEGIAVYFSDVVNDQTSFANVYIGIDPSVYETFGPEGGESFYVGSMV